MRLRYFLLGLGVAVLPVIAQQTYNYFVPGGALSGTNTVQSVNLGAGSYITGNLPVTNLNGGTNASSTTYWGGNGQWTVPPGNANANPSALVGLSAVNGSATTSMRSDGAPALSQAISPTWTGNHVHAPASGIGLTVNALAGNAGIYVTGGNGANLPLDMQDGHSGSTGQYSLRLGQVATNDFDWYDDIASASRLDILSNGSLVAGAPTGGGLGAGTLNAQGLYVNGVAVGSTTAATIGLTAVNGSASTVMRSDAAPALSQAIAPTWTGTHTHTPSSGNAININPATTSAALNISGAAATQIDYLNFGESGQSRWELYSPASSSDIHLYNNAVGDLLIFGGNGGITTSGQANEGGGTINAAALYQKGVTVPKTAFITIGALSSGCTIVGKLGFTTCVRTNTGVYQLALPSAYFTSSTSYGCTVSSYDTVFSGTTTPIGVANYVSSATLVIAYAYSANTGAQNDNLSMNVICVGT